jgi:phage terminase large subunit GpA-like protein
VDVQGDRLEITILGHARDGTAFALGHEALWGAPTDDQTWQELDGILKRRWPHPHGGTLKLDAVCVDGGDGGVMDIVGAFCRPRLARRILCVKGVSGFARVAIQRAKLKRGAPLFLVGVDSVKSLLFARLAKGRSIRFSHTLSPEWFEQLTSEVRKVRMVRGKPTVRFERKPGYAAEALDCMVYAIAAKAALNLSAASFSQREDELRMPVPPPSPRPSVIRSQWMER